jgi:hypothetical protein
MAGGNEYTAAVVSSTEDTAAIIIREVYQDPSQAGRLSFPAKEFKSPRPYISDRVIRHEHDLEFGEEEPDYSIVGVEDKELPAEASSNVDDKDNNEE